jgi:hypothetical protein
MSGGNERKEPIYLGRCREFTLFLSPLRRFLFFRRQGRFLFIFPLIFDLFGHGMRSPRFVGVRDAGSAAVT